jgi:hypothetical protein
MVGMVSVRGLCWKAKGKPRWFEASCRRIAAGIGVQTILPTFPERREESLKDGRRSSARRRFSAIKSIL